MTAHLQTRDARWLLLGLPAFVVGLGLLLIVPRAARLHHLQRETAALAREAERGPTALAGGPAAPPAGAPPASRGEQVAFLERMSALAKASRVRLVQYRPPAARDGTAPGAGEEGTPLLIPRVTEVTVEGSYRDLAAFFRALEHEARLLAPETLSISAARYPRLTATVRLARYVVRELPGAL